mmetsp:Transcript_23614/g.42688  ORF Transcript_23614/g.42688 Transcript_23614/m.42688 type:complete len:205 (+) Transcript_23614:737-1351(+)
MVKFASSSKYRSLKDPCPHTAQSCFSNSHLPLWQANAAWPCWYFAVLSSAWIHGIRITAPSECAGGKLKVPLLLPNFAETAPASQNAHVLPSYCQAPARQRKLTFPSGYALPSNSQGLKIASPSAASPGRAKTPNEDPYVSEKDVNTHLEEVVFASRLCCRSCKACTAQWSPTFWSLMHSSSIPRAPSSIPEFSRISSTACAVT